MLKETIKTVASLIGLAQNNSSEASTLDPAHSVSKNSVSLLGTFCSMPWSNPFGFFDKRQRAKREAAFAYFCSPQTTERLTSASNADDDGDERYRVSSVEEVSRRDSSVAASAGRKRSRDEGGSVSTRGSSKQPRSSGSASYLEPNYTAGSDAFVIAKPVGSRSPYNHSKDWPAPRGPPPLSSAMGGPKGAIKPINTLGKGTPQSSQRDTLRQGIPDNPYKVQTSSGRSRPANTLSVQSSSGSNVRKRLEFPSDEDGYSQAHAKKRRKAGEVEGKSMSVDLTDDAEDEKNETTNGIFGRNVGREQDRRVPTAQVHVSRHATVAGKNERLNSLLTTNTGTNVWNATNVPRSKPRRQGSTGRSSKSKRSSLDSSQNGIAVRGTQSQPLAIDDDEIMPATRGTRETSSNSHSRTDRPTINLTAGFDNVESIRDRFTQRVERQSDVEERPKPPQGSRDDIRSANDLLQNTVRKSGAVPQLQGSQPAKQRHRMQALDFEADGAGSANTHTQQQNLRDKFVRDSPASSTAAAAAASQQRGNANGLQRSPYRQNDPLNDSGDEDILNGETTVMTPKSRKASPSKTTPKSSRPGPNGQPSGTLAPHDADDDAGMTSGQQERVPIRAIHCQAISSQEKGLELVWDDTKDSYYLVHMKQKLHVPLPKSLITIGRRESHIGWIYSDQSLKVQLKGSCTNTTRGSMVIEFADSDGMSQCFSFLYHLSGDQLKHRNVPLDEMERIFARVAEDSEALQKKARNIQQQQRKATKGLYAAPDTADESIQYEVDEPEQTQGRRTRTRDRMQPAPRQSLQHEATEQELIQSAGEKRKTSDTISRYFELAPRRSARQPKPSRVQNRSPTPPPKWTSQNDPKPWPHPLIYPAQGTRRATVEFTDLERLDEGEFLNDSIISFELRRIEEDMKPEHRQKVHFFNTFFYTALTTKNNKKAFNYQAVEKWTKNINLFDIPYVVVPINVNLHWFVAIVCNLHNLERKCTAFDEFADTGNGSATKDDFLDIYDHNSVDESSQAPISSMNQGYEIVENEKLEMQDDNGVSKSEGNGNATGHPTSEDVRPPTSRGRKHKKKAPSLQKYDLKQPVIISMDSLALSRGPEMKFLKQYVEHEAEAKRGIDSVDLRAMTAKGIPEQSNFSDCGVYLCKYVQEFANDPDTFVRKILQREMKPDEFVDFEPSMERDKIRSRLLDLQAKQAAARLEQKKAKAAARAAAKQDLSTFDVPSSSANAAPPPSAAPAPPPSWAPQPREEEETIEKGLSKTSSPLRESTPCPVLPTAPKDSQELEIAPPLALGTSHPGEAGKEDNSRSDDAMLETDESDEANSEDSYRHSHDLESAPNLEARFSSHPPETESPVGGAIHSEGDLLDDLHAEINNPTATTDIIDIGDEADEPRNSEIPESQQQATADADELEF